MKNKKYVILSLLALLVLSGPALSHAFRGDPSERGPNYSQERHEAMLNAFSKKDYSAWKELMNGRGRVTQVVNENNFDKFAEAHNLAQAGDLEGARKIREELGLRSCDGVKGRGGMQNSQRWNR